MQVVDITSDANHPVADTFVGFSMRESGNANSVVVTFRSGTIGGQILTIVTLAASESATLFFPSPLAADDGVYADVSGTGTLEGVIYHY